MRKIITSVKNHIPDRLKISQETPVILLTGFGQFLDPSTMPEIDALTCKPVSIDSLRESIDSVMASQPA